MNHRIWQENIYPVAVLQWRKENSDEILVLIFEFGWKNSTRE